jgi:hypothetical protein
MLLVLKTCYFVIDLTKYLTKARASLTPIDDDAAVSHDLVFAVSSEGALDFVEELQVHESDRQAAKTAHASCG